MDILKFWLNCFLSASYSIYSTPECECVVYFRLLDLNVKQEQVT